MNFKSCVFTSSVLLLMGLSAQAGSGADYSGIFPRPAVKKELGTRPAPVQDLKPAFFTRIEGDSVQLSWAPSEGSTDYLVQVATDANFKWLIHDVSGVKDTNFNVTGLQPGTHYYWRVFALKRGNDLGYVKSASAKSMFIR